MKKQKEVCIIFSVINMNRIKELREERGVKQLELGKLLCCGQQTISRYEGEKREISLEGVRILCRYFGVTADYLLGLSTQRTAQISDDDAEILAAYRRAPDSIRNGINTLLEPYKTKKEAEGL